MSLTRPLVALVLVGACAAAGFYAFDARSRPPETPPPRTARTGAEIFGINEAVSIPEKHIQLGLYTPEQEASLLAEDAAAAYAVGARLVRGPTQVYPYLDRLRFEAQGGDFTRADRWVQAVQGAGLTPLMMVSPWPGNQTAGYAPTYLPDDLDAYAAYVRRVVERYDGDGQDDMPGLREGVHLWEVDNEPDLHNSRPPRDMKAALPPEQFQTPAEYARLLALSAEAIRQADPQARVLMAGLYAIRNEAGRRYAAELAKQPGFLDSFDIANIHCYFDQDELTPVELSLDEVRRLAPGKPIWVTETSVPADGDPSWQDERWQGRMVAAIYGAFLAGGADRVFWHTLADPPVPSQTRRNLPFATNSLLKLPPPPMGSRPPSVASGPPEDKPAGQVYRRLAALLGPTDPALWREVPASGGRLLDVGTGWLVFWGTPTLPAGAGAATDLLTGEVLPAGATVSAPAFVAGAS